jgi:hypothetical protein
VRPALLALALLIPALGANAQNAGDVPAFEVLVIDSAEMPTPD